MRGVNWFIAVCFFVWVLFGADGAFALGVLLVALEVCFFLVTGALKIWKRLCGS